jgi:hypothetical protein
LACLDEAEICLWAHFASRTFDECIISSGAVAALLGATVFFKHSCHTGLACGLTLLIHELALLTIYALNLPLLVLILPPPAVCAFTYRPLLLDRKLAHLT